MTLKKNARRVRKGAHRKGLIAFLTLFALILVSVGSASVSGYGPQELQSSNPVERTQDSSDGLWKRADLRTLNARTAQASPRSFDVVELNAAALSSALANAPMEFTGAAIADKLIMTLPMAGGTFGRFQVEESPAMEPALQDQFPEVKSYRAQGLDDPSATARFDWTPLGLHALVLSENGSIFVEPYSEGDTRHYITFNKEDLQDGFTPPQCEVADTAQATRDLQRGLQQQGGISLAASVGTSLRTYRLAIATTVEYTNNATYGGGKAATLTKLNTIVNLINAIYEREVAIRFQLVASELSIIFDAEPDGLTNSNVGTMLNESVGVINARIGSSAYDIGHSFGLAGAGSSSGVAQLGVVCATNKGRGASTLGIALVTGNFSIDSGLVAHEWGHQFNASHTFNSTSNFCGSTGQRSSASAYEPGSGSTLMAYPGICSPENLQQNSDNYFLGGSFDQIAAYAAGSGSCATSTATGNTAPTVSAGSDFTIPMGTPFTLTGSASDPNGDAITYSWEELDLGSPSPPMTDDGTRPLFRSFPAVTSPSRTFPRLSNILAGTTTIGESLPTTTRNMNFRVTARDNRAAGGGVNSDAMVLSVTSTAGPFVITAPNTAVTWTGGTSPTVTWNVANTTAAPVSCANVKISLSTDGGNTFPTVLLASTPNDGSQSVSVPSVSTSSARIKVEAVGNVFFDISNANFTILPGSSPLSISTSSLPLAFVQGSYSQTLAATGGTAPYTWTLAGGTTLPMDLALSTGGVISGIPRATGAGTRNITVQVTDSASASVQKSLSITVEFRDVPSTHGFYTFINRLAAAGVTAGCGNGNFCPDGTVVRGQMAVFMEKGMGILTPPTPGSQRFTDVPPSHFAYAFIDDSERRGVITVCGTNLFCPDNIVSRADMAVFVERALGVFSPPTPTSQRFLDVPPSHPAYAFIDDFARRGITAGCGSGNYCPDLSVTRGQMAVFLVRAFGL